MTALARWICLGIMTAGGLVGATPFSPLLAQSPPLEIPFVEEWAGSPHAMQGAEPFNHWNEEGEVPPACARCHSTPGFQDYIGADGSEAWKVDKPARIGTVIACVACHNSVTRILDEVTFPSGLKVSGVGPQARCMTCHQGRESTVSVNAALNGLAVDEVSDELRFINIHYRAAGATRFGTLAKGAYEYSGKTYNGEYGHVEKYDECVECHSPHTTKVRVTECISCHKEVESKEDLKIIRAAKADFDGDDDVKEGIAKEIESLHEALYEAIQVYAKEVSNTAIVYDAHQYPYFFTDTNGNGKPDAGEANYGNRYKTWTPRLLKAAYNYQFVAKDPGVYTHNPNYVLQILYDSLEDIGAKVTVAMERMTRAGMSR